MSGAHCEMPLKGELLTSPANIRLGQKGQTLVRAYMGIREEEK
jgi:hypothetical protein